MTSETRSAAGSAGPDLRAALAAAARLRQAGRLGEAERLYRRILKSAPDQPTALNWLGALLHVRGDNARALELIARAARIRPEEPLCLFHLAEVCRATGRHDDAVAAYRRALAHQPATGDLHFGLGTALLALGRAGEAAQELARASAASPDDPQARNNLANALAETGQAAEAEAQYRAALRLDPGYAEAHLNLGLLMAEEDRVSDAEAAFRAALAHDAALVEAWRQLARLLLRGGRGAEALELLERAAAAQPAAPGIARELGDACQELERHQDAAEWYRRAVDLDPDDAGLRLSLGRYLLNLGRAEDALRELHAALERRDDLAEAHFSLGLCLQSIGRFEDAVAAHERALALRPDHADAHINLATIQRSSVDQGEIARLRTLLADPELATEARVSLNFALAKLYESSGEPDAAFAHYRTGNELKARTLPFDAARHSVFVERCIATFDRDFFEARRGFGAESEAPVFILGMPRSGTTLVEQILSAHPNVHGAGELDDFRRLIRELPGRLGPEAGFPECARALDRAACAGLAREHLDSLARRFPPAARITDKMTGNYLRLGLIATLLPQATVIHCRRDPLDTCLSCYFQNFANGLSFTYDLGHLGVVYRQYARLMAHWREVLPLRILDVGYEELVAEPEKVSRAIIGFCGLPWNDRCLSFHEHERQVHTASFWQVRQPIFTSSIGRWRKFARHLGPLRSALDMAPEQTA